MTKVTAREVKDVLKGRWPRLRYVWCWDPHYRLLELEEVRKLVETSKVPEMEFIEYFNDCDDFALHLLSEVRMRSYNARDITRELVPLAVGFVFMLGDGLVIPDHAANIGITNEREVWLMDATDRSVRPAEESDDVRFVFI